MAKSSIYIKPSKRGTFTAAAKSRGKTVQGFASQVMANTDNYSPAMVKKANFARNAASFKKQLGGYLDQQLTETPIQDTPIDSTPVSQTQFGCGGKLARHQDGGYLDLSASEKRSFSEDAKAMGHTIEQHAAHIFQGGGMLGGLAQTANQYSGSFGKGQNKQTFNAQQLAGRHEDLANLKYLDQPDINWGNLIAEIGGSALSAASGAGAFSGGGSSGAFNVGQTAGGQGIEALGQSQLGNSTNLGGSFIRSANLPPSLGKYQDGGILQTNAGYGVPMEFSQEQQEGYLPAYGDGGNLLGYLPEYSFGSWLGDNAGKILKGVGAAASFIPVIGQVAGPILIGAGAATDAIVGSVRKNRAEDELEVAEGREEDRVEQEIQTQGLADNFDPAKNIDYGATFGFQNGGDLVEQSGFPASTQNPVIVGYNGKSNSHQDGVGGVPVDAKGNPSAVSRQSAVGLTEKGEVTWNGYVFSDKLNV